MRIILPRPRYYILDCREPVPVDLPTWGAWFEHSDERLVAEDFPRPDVRVSTVFIGLDYACEGPPRVFETMAFDGDGEPVRCARYSTWDEAEAGHAEVVAHYSAWLN